MMYDENIPIYVPFLWSLFVFVPNQVKLENFNQNLKEKMPLVSSLKS